MIWRPDVDKPFSFLVSEIQTGPFRYQTCSDDLRIIDIFQLSCTHVRQYEAFFLRGVVSFLNKVCTIITLIGLILLKEKDVL